MVNGEGQVDTGLLDELSQGNNFGYESGTEGMDGEAGSIDTDVNTEGQGKRHQRYKRGRKSAKRKCNSVKSCVGRFGKPTRSNTIKNGCCDRCRYKCHKFFPENLRTSDSLNEGLPIKMARKIFHRKRYFFHQNDSRFNSRIVRKSVFLIGQVPI